MKFLNKLERKFGRFAIKNLIYYIIALYVIGYVIMIFSPELYYNYLSLNVSAIFRGQIWRIITYIILPPNENLIFMLFSVYFYYFIGTILEKVWGAFRFNMYFFTGVLLNVVAAIIMYLFTGFPITISTTYYLNMSLFMAYAMVYPDARVLLFFVIPIKTKWLAIIDAVYFAIDLVKYIYGYVNTWNPLYLGSAVAVVVAMTNFIIFYLLTRNYNRVTPKEVYRKSKYKKKVKEKSNSSSRHKCAICGRTEADGDDLVFRYCSKCEGNYEYCQDHLFTHEHKKK